MKKRLLVLFCALALLLTACTKKAVEPPEGAYQVYFAVSGERAATETVDFEYRTLSEGDEVEELMKLLLAGPKTAGLGSPFLSDVRLKSYELREDGTLRVDLSEQYNGLPGVYLTVANACLVLTLSQVRGVESVFITVEGAPLPYQAVQSLRASDLILQSAEEENVSVNALLYFPRKEGGSLGAEYRTVTKTEELGLPAAVLSALLEGPQNGELVSFMPRDTALRDLRVENGICKVDMSGEFLSGEPQDVQAARLTLYSIINTLCAMEELKIQSVQFYVEGESVTRYGGVSATAPLEPDYSLAK